MRRAVGMYEQIVRRFTAQTTDYQELVSTFAEVRAVQQRLTPRGKGGDPHWGF